MKHTKTVAAKTLLLSLNNSKERAENPFKQRISRLLECE